MISQNTLADVIMFFAPLREAEAWVRDALRADALEFQAAAGAVLLKKNEHPQGLPLLTRGCLKITRSPEGNGRSVVLYRIMPGDLCMQSAMSLLSNCPSATDVGVESHAGGALLPSGLFDRLVADSATFRSFVFSRTGSRFGGLVEMVDDLAFGRLETRLARRLLQESAAVQMTHQQLADELGSAREVISRLLRDFENRGAIRRQRGQIEVADAAALRSFAG